MTAGAMADTPERSAYDVVIVGGLVIVVAIHVVAFGLR